MNFFEWLAVVVMAPFWFAIVWVAANWAFRELGWIDDEQEGTT